MLEAQIYIKKHFKILKNKTNLGVSSPNWGWGGWSLLPPSGSIQISLAVSCFCQYQMQKENTSTR